jgi:hypothetical protein
MFHHFFWLDPQFFGHITKGNSTESAGTKPARAPVADSPPQAASSDILLCPRFGVTRGTNELLHIWSICIVYALYVNIYICMYIYIYINALILCVYVYVNVNSEVYAYVYVYVYASVYVYVYV